MMSPGHSLSGPPVAYSLCLLYELSTGVELAWGIPHIAAIIVAGWCNWPDCDTLKSTVSTSLGIITRSLHELVVMLCAVIYYATRSEKDDPKKPVIHRGATHTWPGAVFMGLLVAVICLAWPMWGTIGVLGISLHWAMRGLYIPNSPDKPLGKTALDGHRLFARIGIVVYHRMGVALKRNAVEILRMLPMPGKYLRAFGRTGTFAICLGVAFILVRATPALDTPWAGLLGAAAAVGVLTHMVGDSVTECGICWFFPFRHPRTGKRWEFVHLPKWLAFKTGRAFEYGIVYPLLMLAAMVAMPGGFALVLEVYAAWRTNHVQATALRFAPWLTEPQLTL
jgi:membrane-bound metal-dependent hydrolase YbcI (DUF457 family)